MRRLPFLALLVVIGAAASVKAQHAPHAAPPAAAPVAGHEHDDHDAHDAASSDPAARYASDAVLRREMSIIRDAVEALAHAPTGDVDSARVQQRAGDIERSVLAIIAECKLPPDADAALHAIIVPLLQNATTLKGAPHDTAPVASMRDALARYVQRFDEPWHRADKAD